MEESVTGQLTVNDLDERVTTYDDHDEWYRLVLPRLRNVELAKLAAETGMSNRRVREVLNERAFPHRQHREAFVRIASPKEKQPPPDRYP